MELVYNQNDHYSRYEELLLKRDELVKESIRYQTLYIHYFGDDLLELFQIQIECIKKKKMISYCQLQKNYGNKIEYSKLDAYLEPIMKEYYQQLDQMTKDNLACKDLVTISQYELSTIKKLYRKLAKKIHPDMNPKLFTHETIQDLWQRLQIAYRTSNLKDMKELEVLINKAIREVDGNDNKLEIDIPDLKERIKEIEEEIEKIQTTDPYTYKFILDHQEEMDDKKQYYLQQIQEYQEYAKQLDIILQEFKIEEVIN